MSVYASNATALSAISALNSTAKAKSQTDMRISSGLAVQRASDNAAYWSIATTMKSSNLSLSSAEDAQGLSAAIADTASIGMNATVKILSDIQSKLVLAKSAGVDKSLVNKEISQLKEQLQTVAQSSNFGGQNWLQTEAGQAPKIQSMVGSVTSDAKGDVAINVIDFDTAKSNLVAKGDASDGLLTRSYSGITKSGAAYDFHLLNAGSQVPVSGASSEIGVSNSTTGDEIDGMISAVNSMLRGATDAAADIGATSQRIGSNVTFLQDLQDAYSRGVSRMVDANMEEEAVRQASLSVQQQLQTVGLNIANATMANSLKLFR
ncbi:flagellin [Rhizobium helianthi]|uniref:Flagellin n=1 Tax=Rhizobium helianthi TaxID=1132695 RepID=A0ABW4MAU8_9HYPH